MKTVQLFTLLIVAGASSMQAQTPDTDARQETADAVKWYSIEEAMALQAKTPKKIFVDVYAKWCGPCKMMDRYTFSHPAVAEYLNKNFYPVKFDAEQEEPVTVNGRTYVFHPEYKSGISPGLNEYAIDLLLSEESPQMSYPSTVYLNEKGEKIQMLSGYQQPKIILPILVYFAENYHTKTPWDDYEKNVWATHPARIKN